MLISRHNSLVQLFRSLRDSDGREEHHLYLLEGPHGVREAVQRGIIPHSILWSGPVDEQGTGAELLENLARLGVRVEEVTPDLLDYAGSAKTAQFIMAAVPIPAALPAAGPGPLLLLDGVSDPGNMGTLIRTAAAAGASGAVLHGATADPWNPKTVRGSAGVLTWFPVHPWSLDLLAGRTLIATSSHQGTVYDAEVLTEVYRRPLLIAIGNETHGISPELAPHVTQWIRIPMDGGVESLNVGVAGAVLLFHCRHVQQAGAR